MKPSDIRNALRILHEQEGRDAATMKLDKGLCPYHISPDKEDWERGYDSYAGVRCSDFSLNSNYRSIKY